MLVKCLIIGVFALGLGSDLARKNPSGRARLSWPGSMWGAPAPVLSNRKYLTIVYKRIDLERSGHDKRARPMKT